MQGFAACRSRCRGAVGRRGENVGAAQKAAHGAGAGISEEAQSHYFENNPQQGGGARSQNGLFICNGCRFRRGLGVESTPCPGEQAEIADIL